MFPVHTSVAVMPAISVEGSLCILLGTIVEVKEGQEKEKDMGEKVFRKRIRSW